MPLNINKKKYIFFLIFILMGVFTILVAKKINTLSYDCSKFVFDKDSSTLNLYYSPFMEGIGNRLKKTFSYIRYYKPKNINMYWPSEGWVTAKFLDLFKFDYPVNINYLEYSEEINKRCPRYKYDPLLAVVSTYKLLVYDSDFIDVKPFGIDLKYNKIPQNIKNIYLEYFGKLSPSDKVYERINSINLPKNFVTVQIRTNPDWEKYFGKFDLDSFFNAMNNYPNDTVFYLSAMSKEVANEFYKRFPNRIIELPNKDYHSMIDATADLFILASTNETICSFGSTFCEVAWWINGAKSKVIVIGDDKNWRNKIDVF